MSGNNGGLDIRRRRRPKRNYRKRAYYGNMTCLPFPYCTYCTFQRKKENAQGNIIVRHTIVPTGIYSTVLRQSLEFPSTSKAGISLFGAVPLELCMFVLYLMCNIITIMAGRTGMCPWIFHFHYLSYCVRNIVSFLAQACPCHPFQCKVQQCHLGGLAGEEEETGWKCEIAITFFFFSSADVGQPGCCCCWW